jgi:membrane fusion protein (multidrug efflux system)
MNISRIAAITLALMLPSLPACQPTHAEEELRHEHVKIVVTSPQIKDIVITEQFVCQLHSQRHIEVSVWEAGRLEEITVREGQAVKQGDALFKIVPTLFQAKYDADVAEVRLAELEYKNTKKLADDPAKVVSQNEVLLFQAKLDKAKAKLKQSEAELNFTTVRAPFDGIIDRQLKQQGSMMKEGEILTTLSDNSVMWVYFNVPEARDLAFTAAAVESQERQQIGLLLANGVKYARPGKMGPKGSTVNNETGNRRYRADFSNPDGQLRHGQTGNVVISRTLKDALVIPQRATFEILDKRYVYVVDDKGTVRQRGIVVEREQEDIFVVKSDVVMKGKAIVSGIDAKDQIVLEGIRQVHDGDTVESEFRKPDVALATPKYHAE